ncbi:MAG: (E)-4-hydroxy-3-methylbut-2-enyl-diphosphate synthase [Prevotellaceae bacterium]|nr:(E)-4-hydroxy-3-methylbut-2-enyl-diphosphate synthase [Prevotellaceae bacterium]
MDLFNYSRRHTTVVNVGALPMGGDYPIRLQSMTNTATQDTGACVAQAKRIVDAGGEYVRLTTQGVKEAENLRLVNAALRRDGYTVPLVADVHFNPRVADVAALYAEKVRVNPGNYVDAARTFKQLSYTDEEYAKEVEKIRARFVPFLRVCKEHHTAIRIGVNHGSLSDRIMSRYGDTPRGMVESCMEFLRLCVEEQFTDVVISIKASNAVVMVKTVRLLVDSMEKEGMHFPLHLGVTEAGDGEDGRIKSALGIGALLADGLGDTVRVSLSEPPEAEIPVARLLVDYIRQRQGHPYIPGAVAPGFDYLSPARRKTRAVGNIGGEHTPVVMAARLDGDLTFNPQFMPDYVYTGGWVPEDNKATTDAVEADAVKADAVKADEVNAIAVKADAKQAAAVRPKSPVLIVDCNRWQGGAHSWPAFNSAQFPLLGCSHAAMKFLFLTYMELTEEAIACLKQHPEVVVVAGSNHPNRLGEQRALAHQLTSEGLQNPVVFFQHYAEDAADSLAVKAAADMGALIFDGLCDGVFLFNQKPAPKATAVDEIAFGILQAGRLRTVKTEYISCPGCGRTLYHLESTIARIKAATSHLKGLKIGIMGCIVNGPGEMADADYGYVGAGRGKISLYKKTECIEKNIPESEAVEKLIELIKKNGDYVEREQAGA